MHKNALRSGVILDYATLAAVDLDTRALLAAVPQWQIFAGTRPDEVAARIAAADVVLTNKVVLNAKLLAQAPNLRLVAIMATGTNNVDIAAARARGITVCNAVGYSTASVVQHT